MISRHARAQARRVASYGSDDFAATLAERESALGLHTQGNVRVRVADALPDADVTETTPEPPVDTAGGANGAGGEWQRLQRQWGNEIVSAIGEYGQHVVRSWIDGKLVRVCGTMRTSEHLAWWVFDEETMRFECARCWPMWQRDHAVSDGSHESST